MGFFKRRHKTNPTENQFSFRFVYYGEKPEEFCIFAGLDNPEIQKREKVWVSWEAIEQFLHEKGAIERFALELDRNSTNFIEEEMKKRFRI